MINKQSNLYTIIYIVVLAVVVGAALAFTSLQLADKQRQNADVDKMRQILAAARITPPSDSVMQAFSQFIIRQEVVNSQGENIPGDAFDIDVAAQSKLNDAARQLPVFVCRTAGGETKYILPAYGAGLWGPIWGYIAIDADGSTIYGAYFAHQGETPGLGAEIEKPAFSDKFNGKHLFKDGEFLPVAVVKAGQRPAGNEDYVDGVSGGTITSKGVSDMLSNSLKPYESYLKNISRK